ncbi:MAG: hypothetical protein V8S33_08150 [Intestinibacter bartlettii]
MFNLYNDYDNSANDTWISFIFKTQVKSFDLVTNKEIPISKISGFYVDSDENFYVGIDDFSWIEIFDKNGKFVCSIAMKGLVYNFYVDKDGLLHIFCTYRTSDNIYEQIIDIEKNSIISEEVIKDEPAVNMNPKRKFLLIINYTVSIKML